MASFNKIILVGNVVRDPELRYSPANLAVVRTALAVNRKYKEKDETMFIDIIAFGKQAETLNSYATKGTAILIEGRLSQNKWEDEDGKNRSKHEVIVDTFQLLGGRKEKSEEFADKSFKMSDRIAEEDDIPF